MLATESLLGTKKKKTAAATMAVPKVIIAKSCREWVIFFIIYLSSGQKKAGTFRNLPMVGVSGFEPEASWTRTKRDTKLRHTPKSMIL